MNSSNTAYLIQENTLKLQEVFESPVDVLREILMNCGLNLEVAIAMCDELGIPRVAKQIKRKRKKEPPIDVQGTSIPESNPFDCPDIRQLREMFPSMDMKKLAGLYWDCGNNLTKTVNKIIGVERVYIPEAPSVEIEYLKLRFSFIPADIVTATFLRCGNDYNKCLRALSDEQGEVIRQHWSEYQSFLHRHGQRKHSAIIAEYYRSIPRSKAVPLSSYQDDDEEGDDRPLHLSSSQRQALTERHNASSHLQTIRVLRNIRSEESRGYGKYLTGTVAAIEREHQLYAQENAYSANTIFAFHNDNRKIETLLAHGQPVDFHGLQVQEAEKYMNRILQYLRKYPVRKKVTIITGQGNHSRNQRSPIREYVIDRLKEERIKYDVEGGQVIFSL